MNRALSQTEIVSPTRQGIQEAAIACFEKFSVKKTSVEDICAQAGISRPTFYRFFKNKNDLLLELGRDETTRLSRDIATFCESDKDIADIFVDAMCYVIDQCHKSKIVRFMISPENLMSTLSVTFSDEHALDGQMDGWRVLYEKADSQGRLRVPAEASEITRWLSLVRVLLFNYIKATKADPDEIRSMIEKFVIPAIVSPPSRSKRS
ncbi:MAG: TetR/AcrR family transcriptional regulator [Parahaliea sp.]